MIVQTAPPEQPHLVITQIDHAALSGDFAAVFGNSQFESPSPREAMIFVAAHHDDGWQETDDACLLDNKSGLPYHLTQTPLPELVKTSARSPDINEAHHPYSGLMSSMHTYGLFNGRYGLSDKIFIDLIPAEHKPAMEAMLAAELVRQAKLKAILGQSNDMAQAISEVGLLTNYKRLQFFDTLALYFHMVHPEAREEATFVNVPQKVGQDITITIRPAAPQTYTLAPYPFQEPEINFSYRGRLLRPQTSQNIDLKQIMANTPFREEKFTLVDAAVWRGNTP